MHLRQCQQARCRGFQRAEVVSPIVLLLPELPQPLALPVALGLHPDIG